MSRVQVDKTIRNAGPWLTKCARRWPGLDRDDATQLARISLYAACVAWSPTGGASPTTFASMPAHARLRGASRTEVRHRAASLDGPIHDDHGGNLHDLLEASTPASPLAQLLDKERETLLHDAIESLPPRGRVLIRARLDGRPITDIARMLDCSRKCATALEAATLRLLRERLERLGLTSL